MTRQGDDAGDGVVKEESEENGGEIFDRCNISRKNVLNCPVCSMALSRNTGNFDRVEQIKAPALNTKRKVNLWYFVALVCTKSCHRHGNSMTYYCIPDCWNIFYDFNGDVCWFGTVASTVLTRLTGQSMHQVQE